MRPRRAAEASLHAVDGVVARTRDGAVDRLRQQLRAHDAAAGGAQGGDVGHGREPQHDGEEEQPHLLGERDDRDDAADHPDELEAGLELGERAPANGIRTVALQEAVEPEPPGRGADPQRERGEHEARRAGHQRTEQREGSGDHERRREDHLFAHGAAERGRDEHTDEVPDVGGAAGQAQREEIVLERERGEERQEADASPQHGHRARTEQDARRVHLVPFQPSASARRRARAVASAESGSRGSSRPRTRPRRSAATSRRRRACRPRTRARPRRTRRSR